MHIVRKATLNDLYSIKQMIQEAGIDDSGVEQGLKHFFVIEDVSKEGDSPFLVGTVGLEVYPPYGLLRSFVLKKEAWNVKVYLRMMEVVLTYASNLSLKQIYLFAKEASPLLEQLGFLEISPKELPDSIRASQHHQRMKKQAVPMMYPCSNKSPVH